MDPAHGVERFTVAQKITLMVNRYEIRAVDDAGRPGELLAFAQQKRTAFKEQVAFYRDESRKEALFSFKARQRLDLGAVYDVLDADGQPIGSFRKDFGASLLRSTWHIEAAGVQARGSERSAGVAIGRRVWEMLPVLEAIPSPFRFHFDFVDRSGRTVMTSERGQSLRDRYLVTLPGAVLDARVAAAMAVALDALQSR
jgi:catechol 2,3-dioxygenase-like lactoylglutathione lyase family enzyme